MATRLTAKKGMIEYKKGFSKMEFDYDFIEDIPYNDKVSVRNVVEGLRSADKQCGSEIKLLKEENAKLNTKIDLLIKQVAEAVNLANEVERKHLETIKGLISR